MLCNSKVEAMHNVKHHFKDAKSWYQNQWGIAHRIDHNLPPVQRLHECSSMPRLCVQFPEVQPLYVAACSAEVTDPAGSVMFLQQQTLLHVCFFFCIFSSFLEILVYISLYGYGGRRIKYHFAIGSGVDITRSGVVLVLCDREFVFYICDRWSLLELTAACVVSRRSQGLLVPSLVALGYSVGGLGLLS